MHRTHQRAVWRDAHYRERERRVERRPHERAIVGSPFGRRLIEDIEQRPHPLEAGRFGQLLIRCKPLMGRVEVRERVEEERQASGFPGEEPANERGRARRLYADELLPEGLRAVPARYDYSTRVDSEAAAESRERAGMSPQDFQRLPVRSEGSEGLVVERGEAVIEQRGGPLGEDRRDQLVVGHLSPQDRVAPHRRIERQRNGVAGLLVRGAEQFLEARLDRGVAGVLSVRGIERDADDVEDDVAAIGIGDAQRFGEAGDRDAQRGRRADSWLPGADRAVGEHQHDEREGPCPIHDRRRRSRLFYLFPRVSAARRRPPANRADAARTRSPSPCRTASTTPGRTSGAYVNIGATTRCRYNGLPGSQFGSRRA